MRIRVKICGVTVPEDIRAAVLHGADAVGFVFADSPRRVSIEDAQRLAREVPPFVARVAVFRQPRPDDVARVMGLFDPDVVQTEVDPAVAAVLPEHATWLPVLHDHDALLDDVTRCLEEYGQRVSAVLLEAPGRGGRGIAPSWERAAQLAGIIPLVLAGGLTPDNVGDAITRVAPYAVDVSSGVESSPGRKEQQRIAAFLSAVRKAEREVRSAPEVMT